jgi:hypothetical protein
MRRPLFSTTLLLLLAGCSSSKAPTPSAPIACDPGFSGPSCATLTPLPSPVAGALDDAQASYWDGSAIEDASGSWHLFASRFVNGCGLSSWTTNSECVHAVAATPLGPFQVDSVVTPAFCHNPVIRRADDGTYLLYSIGAPVDPSMLVTNCQGGVTLATVPTTSNPSTCDIRVQSAPSLTGPWQAAMTFTSSGSIPLCPTNPAPVVEGGGAVALYFRAYQAGGDAGVTELLFGTEAPAWSGPYAFGALRPLFERQGEDPFVWRSNDGSLRMLFNDKFTSPTEVGGFAIRGDGGEWAPAGNVYGLDISLQDGTTLHAARRERPSIAWTADGAGAVLYTGVVPTADSDRAYVMATPLTALR